MAFDGTGVATWVLILVIIVAIIILVICGATGVFTRQTNTGMEDIVTVTPSSPLLHSSLEGTAPISPLSSSPDLQFISAWLDRAKWVHVLLHVRPSLALHEALILTIFDGIDKHTVLRSSAFTFTAIGDSELIVPLPAQCHPSNLLHCDLSMQRMPHARPLLTAAIRDRPLHPSMQESPNFRAIVLRAV